MAIQGKRTLWYWQKQWFWAVLGTTHDEKDNQPNQQAWFNVVDGYLSNIKTHHLVTYLYSVANHCAFGCFVQK